MTRDTNRLSRLMHISWDIQKQRHNTRSKALTQAWAIFSNEDITVHYLTRKLNHHKQVSKQIEGQFALFNK